MITILLTVASITGFLLWVRYEYNNAIEMDAFGEFVTRKEIDSDQTFKR